MSKQYFTPAQVERCRQVFLTMPSYDPATNTISASDIPILVHNMGYDKLPEPDQIQAYVDFHGPESVHCGRMKMDNYIQYIRVLTDTKAFATSLFESYDVDKDGFISADEFVPILNCLQSHDKDFPKDCPYEKFLLEADTNGDGKVSVEEGVNWVGKYINN